MRRPSIKHLPEPWFSAVRQAAQKLHARGFRAWIVGGAVRDLALDRKPKDADLASAATPQIVEDIFERTITVGKAFGTVRVHLGGIELEVTTFRSDGAYDDGRHPDGVAFSESIEEDARRRDFTANALFLDPLEDELCDPTGGLADIEAGRLRCVGEPRERFGEDGLRILRLARFAARYGWEVEPDTLAGASESLDALRGVSAERVLQELESIGGGEGPQLAVEILWRAGALARLFPALADVLPDVHASLVRACEEALLDPSLFLALLFAPLHAKDARLGLDVLEGLRASRARTKEVLGTWDIATRIGECLARDSMARSQRIRLVRDPAFGRALRLRRATTEASSHAALDELVAFERSLSQQDKFPQAWLCADDLGDAGVAPGPDYGRILEEADDLRLEGRHPDRQTALDWLLERLGKQAP